jgi:homoserine O-acetyltransferase
MGIVHRFLTGAVLLVSPVVFAQNPDTAERHEFVISNFRTESGVTLPQAHVVYGTYGHLNAAKDNAGARRRSGDQAARRASQ